ncbi:MAG: DUF402 domain-containing protein [Clostridiales bacterium]|jgi:predicted RNA-binding protein associated with RNAse of E/G family|nr:DUF402 domain-containing protein [Clostridiales bacterium]
MEPERIKLYRRRYIPNERVLLDKDEVVRADDERVLTRWRAIRPRRDFARGDSVYFLNDGVKVSRMFRADGGFVYWYCDIIEVSSEPGVYVFSDLLADVIVEPGGGVRVLDVGEIADALDSGLISVAQAKKALRALDWLLALIYGGRFGELTAAFDGFEKTRG